MKHAHGIVRAQYRDCRPDADAGRACGDRGENDVGGRQGEVIGVVFTDSEEVDADLVGKDTLFDEVPDRLGMRERAIVIVVGDIAEGVETEDKWELSVSVLEIACRFCRCCGHVDYAASARRADSNSGRRSETPKTGQPGSRRRPALRLSSRTVS